MMKRAIDIAGINEDDTKLVVFDAAFVYGVRWRHFKRLFIQFFRLGQSSYLLIDRTHSFVGLQESLKSDHTKLAEASTPTEAVSIATQVKTFPKPAFRFIKITQTLDT